MNLDHCVDQGTKARSVPRSSGLAGTVWFVGWLFTIGFAKVAGWKILLALAIWPYLFEVDPVVRTTGAGS